MNRRTASKFLAATGLAPALSAPLPSEPKPFRLRHVLSSALYGEMSLDAILPEIAATRCESIDIWRRKHRNQREQIQEMGDDAFGRLLEIHDARLGLSTCYPLGPFGLQEEIGWVAKFRGEMVLCGSGRNGPAEPTGSEAKRQVKDFLEKMKPHVAVAEKHGVTIALENHSRQMLYHPDSLRWFAELNGSTNLGVALAPHHLREFESEIPALIRDLGDDHLAFVYFQEHSKGIYENVPKEIELQQLPGFGGGLDYVPIIGALKDVGFTGLVEIFMHPVPRGIPILPTISEIRTVLLRARSYVDACLAEVNAA